MDRKAIFKFCKTLGCCDSCCLRYIGVKNPDAYENYTNYVTKYQDEQESEAISKETEDFTDFTVESIETTTNKHSNVENENLNGLNNEKNGTLNSPPPSKKRKTDICCSCLGVLQDEVCQESCIMVKEVMDKKGYEASSFACALSCPIATMLRERVITLHLTEQFPEYEPKIVTPLKEAWKWSFGNKLPSYINKTLDSGAHCPLLITVNMDYVDDLQELEILKVVSPKLFQQRSKQKRRFATEFTRRSVEQALETASLKAVKAAGGGLPEPSARAHPVSVITSHVPFYLAGRYIKLSRNLPQSPWILEEKRVLESSVQEIIYGPIAKALNFEPEDVDRRLKIIAAGREDVDVRCLGDGRPFAIEITDPSRRLSQEELAEVCEEISKSGGVVVKNLVHIKREDLVQLKKGEETKNKTYEAICIKLTHSEYDEVSPNSPVRVTEKDIEAINTYTQKYGVIQQRTPIRVLHRRPLLTRTRQILQVTGETIPGYPQLFKILVTTSAGTYVKEWAHGECGRTSPALPLALRARLDLLALDVARVHLDWPPTPPHFHDDVHLN